MLIRKKTPDILVINGSLYGWAMILFVISLSFIWLIMIKLASDASLFERTLTSAFYAIPMLLTLYWGMKCSYSNTLILDTNTGLAKWRHRMFWRTGKRDFDLIHVSRAIVTRKDLRYDPEKPQFVPSIVSLELGSGMHEGIHQFTVSNFLTKSRAEALATTINDWLDQARR